jgi:hypothetical protein
VPVPQHVDLDADPPSCCTDPHCHVRSS